jgi:pterin-4a-carbinolamine dehydratase
VARVAKSQGHHPGFQVSLRRVVVDLTSYNAGELASLIDQA